MEIAESFHRGGTGESCGPKVLLWSAEEPHLYILTLELSVGKEQKVIQFESCQVIVVVHSLVSGGICTSHLLCAILSSPFPLPRTNYYQLLPTTTNYLQVGFRHTEVVKGKARLIHNGRPVMLRGVNRHEFDPRKGKALTEGDMVADIVAMKRVSGKSCCDALV
jgi:hypothetical protein